MGFRANFGWVKGFKTLPHPSPPPVQDRRKHDYSLSMNIQRGQNQLDTTLSDPIQIRRRNPIGNRAIS